MLEIDLFKKLDKLGLRPLVDPNERPSVSQNDVERLEALFGYRFPHQYLEFLLRYGVSGASAFYYDTVFFDVPDNWDDVTEGSTNDVRIFYGFSDAEKQPDIWALEYAIRSTRTDRLPHHFLPICESDGLSTVVYISCREQDYGHIYALTRNQIWDVPNAEVAAQEAFHLADSFEGFIVNLRRDDEGEESLDMAAMGPLYTALYTQDTAYLQRIVDAGKMEIYRSNILETAITGQLSWPAEFFLQHNIPTDGALAKAVQYANLEVIRLLIANGEDINAPTPINRISDEWQTYLISAVQQNDYYRKYEVVRLLVELGADVKISDSQGKTVFDYVHPNNAKMREILEKA